MSPDEERLRDAKIALITLLGLFTFACSCVPWCLKRVFKRQSLDWLNVTTAFAAVRESAGALRSAQARAPSRPPPPPLAPAPRARRALSLAP